MSVLLVVLNVCTINRQRHSQLGRLKPGSLRGPQSSGRGDRSPPFHHWFKRYKIRPNRNATERLQTWFAQTLKYGLVPSRKVSYHISRQHPSWNFSLLLHLDLASKNRFIIKYKIFYCQPVKTEKNISQLSTASLYSLFIYASLHNVHIFTWICKTGGEWISSTCLRAIDPLPSQYESYRTYLLPVWGL